MGAGLRSRAQTFSVPYSPSWRRSFGSVILARHRLVRPILDVHRFRWAPENEMDHLSEYDGPVTPDHDVAQKNRLK
jgi:hypothetical protein